MAQQTATGLDFMFYSTLTRYISYSAKNVFEIVDQEETNTSTCYQTCYHVYQTHVGMNVDFWTGMNVNWWTGMSVTVGQV